MKTKLFYLLLAPLFLIGISTKAQTTDEMTPYELGREKLAVETLEKVSNSMSVYDQLALALGMTKVLEKAGDDRFAQTLALESLIFSLFDMGDLFKNEAEYWFDSSSSMSYYSASQISGWRQISNWYKTQRSELETTKTAEDIAREQERLKQSRGIGLLFKNIRKEFSSWAKRGELEKTSDYQKRMEENAAEAFDSICFVSCCNILKENVSISKVGYDPDSEIYTVAWNIIDNKSHILSTREYTCKLDPTKLADLKKNGSFKYYVNLDKIKVLNIGVSEEYVYPLTAKLMLNGELVQVSSRDMQPLTISPSDVITDELVISVMKNHTFNYATYLDNVVSGDDLENILYEIRKSFTNAYKVQYSYDYADNYPYSYEHKPYYSKKEADTHIANCRDRYAKELYERLWHYYEFYPKYEEIAEDIYSYDVNAVKQRIIETERLKFKEIALNDLTENVLKGSLYRVSIFNLLFESYSARFANSKEELCKILIENNAYLTKKVKVKDSYYNALVKFYRKNALK